MTVPNYDPRTVAGFGDEWNRFDQSHVDYDELVELFQGYFRIFPWSELPHDAIGFDVGCGSGRWAMLVAPKVARLYCIDRSFVAVNVAQKNLRRLHNCEVFVASVDGLPLADNSMDFGYSLGVLHHLPDTVAGIKSCVDKLKPGAPFLLYLYYAFDNRPGWFRLIWRLTDIARRLISELPFKLRYVITQLIAIAVYYPLARISLVLERGGARVDAFPLSSYRKRSFYCMRTDALDRFGTRLEKRFTSVEVREMMEAAGLEKIKISDLPPYWCAMGYKNSFREPSRSSAECVV